MQNEEDTKKTTDGEVDITSNDDLVTDVIMPMEPATGAEENNGPSEGEDYVDDPDGIARENTTPDGPESPEGDR